MQQAYRALLREQPGTPDWCRRLECVDLDNIVAIARLGWRFGYGPRLQARNAADAWLAVDFRPESEPRQQQRESPSVDAPP
jgi:hypothetical protein